MIPVYDATAIIHAAEAASVTSGGKPVTPGGGPVDALDLFKVLPPAGYEWFDLEADQPPPGWINPYWRVRRIQVDVFRFERL